MCEKCQKHQSIPKQNSKLQSIPVPSEVTKQIGVDICNLATVDGYKHLVVAIDYFSKWSEAKPLKDKLAISVAEFLYELVCRHGCFQIQINDQGREFVNAVADTLHDMTGVDQRITSAYHPQSNRLCERQNRTIKYSLVKVLNENPEEWPSIIEGILFAHRVSRHSSTKFSPFYLLYHREPTLPIDLKYNFDSEQTGIEEPFDSRIFEAVLCNSQSIRKSIHEKASANISKSREMQKFYYDRRNSAPFSITIGSKVLLKNNSRDDRKGGKFSCRWGGPYVITGLTDKGAASLQNMKGKKLKKKYNASQLIEYHKTVPDDLIDDCEEVEEFNEKRETDDGNEGNQLGGIDNQDEISMINHFDKIPNEVLQINLLDAILNSEFGVLKCKT